MSHSRNQFYDILEIHKSSSTEDIRKAYKKQALKYHPDKSSSDNAEEEFRKIKRASEVLCDPEKRRIYDQYGIEQVEKYERHENTSFFGEDVDEFDLFHFVFRVPRFDFGSRFFWGSQEERDCENPFCMGSCVFCYRRFPTTNTAYSNPHDSTFGRKCNKEESSARKSNKQSESSPKPLKTDIADLRENLSGITKFAKFKASNSKVFCISQSDYDKIQVEDSLAGGKSFKEFKENVLYQVKDEPLFSFICCAGAVNYLVKMPVKFAHKEEREIELVIPNGNVLIVTVSGLMSPGIEESQWVFEGEGLKSSRPLVLKFQIEYPPEKDNKKKKGRKRK